MNPYDERRLRDEVIYLHYLWDQGPPHHQQPNPIHLPIRSLHNTIPSSSSQPHLHPHHPWQLRHHHQEHTFAPSHTRSLPPVASTAFKKRNNKKKTMGEDKESLAADDDGKDGSCKTEDIAVSLEHVEDAVEEHAKGVDQSIGECSSKQGDIDEKMVHIGLGNGGGEARYVGESTKKVDEDGIHISDLALGHEDKTVEEQARGVDQSISDVIFL